LVAAGVVMLGVAGWMVWQRMAQPPAAATATAVAGPEASTAAPAAPGTAPPAATTATPATTPAPEAAPAAVDAATGQAPGAEGEGSPQVLAHYGHGGPNTKLNRVRVRAARELSAEELLVREQARQQNELAAAAALEQQNTAAVAPATPHVAEPAPGKERKSFMCRVFKKCDPPKRKAGTPEPPPAPTTP
jgi:hypothetical protein